MNQQSSLESSKRNRPKVSPWLKQGMSLLGGLGIISSGLGWTQAFALTETLVIPESPAPVTKPEAISPSPVKIPKASPYVVPSGATQTKPTLQRTQFKPEEPKVAPKPSISPRQETAAPKVKLSAPKILDPATAKSDSSSSINPVISQPQTIQLAPSVTIQGQNSYIDTTSYGKVPSQRATSPGSVVLTERSTGCQTVANNGQLLRVSCGPVARNQPTPTLAQPIAPRRVTLASRRQTIPVTVAVAQGLGSAPLQVQPLRIKNRPVSSEQVVSLQPIARQGFSIALEPIPRYNRAASMYAAATGTPQGRTDLIFPLPVVASITSAFGWRTHPIAGTGRMHNGTDIGAPLGTPVLAAYAGEVLNADWLGGYGLAVTLRHLEGTQESLYAHLSEIYVQPGESVEQGTVIGRVGSTGYSTGPHLHFEWRHLTEEGWVAVDAGVHLEYALDNLMRAMQLAQSQNKPQG
ncbi:peptidoglycan DD-metalloendopeptidase family protein [Crocosphaera sp. UHCC 0190]|uniref:M23 family metallopeptidase n=1 Tax=Crocosphaera sp. UHCC 0190 TaxID=3110246 RepID=UPI002B1FD6DD|nr:peptidoglycan DD-metalloendopeptidase family protein [Crocosphaera sp. UHCC 0190]MEA5509926.1 peptidoglycan DD-metalloendopeptidase family protein [Crocosphaera sp. UHCC 0190]